MSLAAFGARIPSPLHPFTRILRMAGVELCGVDEQPAQDTEALHGQVSRQRSIFGDFGFLTGRLEGQGGISHATHGVPSLFLGRWVPLRERAWVENTIDYPTPHPTTDSSSWLRSSSSRWVAV